MLPILGRLCLGVSLVSLLDLEFHEGRNIMFPDVPTATDAQGPVVDKSLLEVPLVVFSLPSALDVRKP